MVEVFITNIQNKVEAARTITAIKKDNAELKINYDLNETEFPFPCGHTILRAEGDTINSDKIIEIVRAQGLNCEILEDEICK